MLFGPQQKVAAVSYGSVCRSLCGHTKARRVQQDWPRGNLAKEQRVDGQVALRILFHIKKKLVRAIAYHVPRG
eukprot:scaffold233211_cov37-Tisochrysis_lutea.AAC.1